MRHDTSTGCGTCGTYHDHAPWCDRNPSHPRYPDRNRFRAPYDREVSDER